MNFLGVGPFELLLVMIIATIVLGPERMAETGRLLGLEEGDAHVIRNAGGVVTDDVIRSLRK